MSEDIPLNVVYQRVEVEDEVVEVEKKDTLEEEKEVSLEVSKSDDCEEKKEKCKKKWKRGVCYRTCACFGMFTAMMILINAIVISSLSIRMYMSLNQCFHSKENVLKEAKIHDNGIDRINIDVVSGFVHVKFHEKNDIIVRIWNNARTKAYINEETFDSGYSHVVNSSLNIHAITPAFNFKSCEHSSIEVLIPENHPKLLTISGKVKLGMVKIEGLYQKSVSNIDFTVEVGKIKVHNIVSKSLSLSTELGVIKVADTIISHDTKLQSHTGLIKTRDLFTKTLTSVNQIGCSMHSYLVADDAKVETKFGYSKVYRASSLGKEIDLQINTEYGKSTLVSDSKNIDFKLGTNKGKLKVIYDDESWVCKIDKSIIHKNGKCNTLKAGTHDELSKLKLGMNTKYGKTKLVIKEEQKQD